MNTHDFQNISDRFSKTFCRKNIFHAAAFFMLLAFLNLVIGCSYYKVTSTPPDTKAMTKVQLAKKYVILHIGKEVWHIKDIKLDEQSKNIICTKEIPDNRHLYFITADTTTYNRYKSKDVDPTYEINIYANSYSENPDASISVQLSEIQKIDIYDQAVGATVVSYVFSALGIIIGAFLIVAVILLLTKGSCPFVYVDNGSSYHFTGEMYGGAIYSSLERDDYMPLPEATTGTGTYRIKISNELLERQYTNVARLMMIECKPNTNVLIDKYGKVQTISQPEKPLSAISDQNIDHTLQVTGRDSNAFTFGDESKVNKQFSSLTLSFDKPLKAKTGKLILNAKNSFWLDYIYGKFTEQFGVYYNQFAVKQKKVPARKNIAWSLQQGIPLSVYVETKKGWEFVDYFNVIGPLASRDLVLPVDLSSVEGSKVNIRLDCGFMFWEIDYASMDFSENIPVKTEILIPASALDQDGKDISSALAKADKEYLVQPEPGNEVELIYSIPAKAENVSRKFYLESRGYYEYIRDYKNKPDILYLYSFKKKGAFTKFSRERYNDFIGTKNFISSALNTGNGN